MDYLFLVLYIAMNSSQFIFSSLYNRRQKNADPYLCTLLIGATVLAFYAVYGQFRFEYDGDTLLYGLIFGGAYCVGYIFQIKALKVGSVSLTSLLLSYSLLVPILFGVLYYHDSVGVTFWIGLSLLLVALFLVNFDPAERSASTADKKNKMLWLVFALLSFCGNAACVIAATMQQKLTGGAHRFEFMTYAMALVIVLNLTLTLINNKKTGATLPSLKRGWWCAVILGLLNGATNLCYMILAAHGNIPVSLINCFNSGGSLLLTFLLARFIFKEKLRPLQLVGFLIGVASVVLFSI